MYVGPSECVEHHRSLGDSPTASRAIRLERALETARRGPTTQRLAMQAKQKIGLPPGRDSTRQLPLGCGLCSSVGLGPLRVLTPVSESRQHS